MSGPFRPVTPLRSNSLRIRSPPGSPSSSPYRAHRRQCSTRDEVPLVPLIAPNRIVRGTAPFGPDGPCYVDITIDDDLHLLPQRYYPDVVNVARLKHQSSGLNRETARNAELFGDSVKPVNMVFTCKDPDDERYRRRGMLVLTGPSYMINPVLPIPFAEFTLLLDVGVFSFSFASFLFTEDYCSGQD